MNAKPRRSMRIFITAHNSRVGGGISVAKNLISAFGRLAPQHEYFFTIPSSLGYEECCAIAPCYEKLVYCCPGLVKRWLWETTALVRIMKAFHPDVIFNMANHGFIKPCVPQATLIQDPHLFYPLRQFGEVAPLGRLIFWYHRQHLRRSLRATQILLCQTDVAQQRLMDTYRLPYAPEIIPNQLSNIMVFDNSDLPKPAVLQRFDNQFKLFVPTRYYAHKNLEVIPKLFERYRGLLKDVTFILTISEDEHSRAARLLKRIKNVASNTNLVAVRNLKQDELPAFYRYSDALFLPTLLESFSSAYLEAMRYERPIITSDMDFAHTICGNAAVYVDPYDVTSIYKGIMAVKKSTDLREGLVRAGRERLTDKGQSWDEIGMSIIKILERIGDDESNG